MAMDFYLKLKTSLEPKEIADMIVEFDGFIKDEDDEHYFRADGIYGGVIPMSETGIEVLREETGIDANLRIWFRLEASEEFYKLGLRNGLKAFMKILENTDGDAVIRLNDDDVKLIRKNGKVILNSESFFEDEEAMWRIKDVPLRNFEVKELAWNGAIIS